MQHKFCKNFKDFANFSINFHLTLYFSKDDCPCLIKLYIYNNSKGELWKDESHKKFSYINLIFFDVTHYNFKSQKLFIAAYLYLNIFFYHKYSSITLIIKVLKSIKNKFKK